jgi:molecular chaperone GrpE
MTEGLLSPQPDVPVDRAGEPGTGAPAAPAPAEQPGQSGPSPVEVALARLADDSKRYHERAAHREDVIDRMHAELDQLRRGERRSMLRPLLSEVCRLRDDLLRQAEGLPADFDGPRASTLLRSYAESIEIALADNGVSTYEPEPDDHFEPRGHRAVGRLPSPDPDLVGRIARVRKSGYRDVETNLPIAPAEVVVYVPAPPPEPGRHAHPAESPAGTPMPDDATSPAPTRGATR